MKRKLLIAAGIVGIVTLTSTATYAATRELPWTNNIYSVSHTDNSNSPTVSVFDDAGNKCYVVKNVFGNGGVAISCIKDSLR